jgi:hypothetical protein
MFSTHEFLGCSDANARGDRPLGGLATTRRSLFRPPLFTNEMTDESPSDQPHNPYRSFTDSSGAQWLVWKVAEADVSEIRGRGAADSPSLGKAWLVFLSMSGETRRITPVPAEWRSLSDAELDALVRDAKPFQRRS